MTGGEKALLYNLRSLARMEHADLSIGDEAADAIERIARERDEARASESRMIREIDAVYAAVSNHWFLDPPDGGDVRLHEGVARIEQALTEARAEIERMRGALAVIKNHAEQPQINYDRTGPTWTSRKSGAEYEDTSTHLEFAQEIVDLCDAATLTPATPPAHEQEGR